MGRGLFRIWLVLTIVWAAFVFFASSDDSRPEAMTIVLKAAFVPPAIVLLIGLMLLWAFKGFSRRN